MSGTINTKIIKHSEPEHYQLKSHDNLKYTIFHFYRHFKNVFINLLKTIKIQLAMCLLTDVKNHTDWQKPICDFSSEFKEQKTSPNFSPKAVGYFVLVNS